MAKIVGGSVLLDLDDRIEFVDDRGVSHVISWSNNLNKFIFDGYEMYDGAAPLNTDDLELLLGLFDDVEEQVTLAQEQVGLAADQVTLAESQVGLAADQVTLAQEQVGLIAGQVTLAQEQVGLAADQVTLAEGVKDECGNIMTNMLNEMKYFTFRSLYKGGF